MFCIGFLSGSALNIVVFLFWRCQLGLALAYLMDLCRSVSGGPGVADPFALLRGEFWWSRLPVKRLCRTAHSRWRALGFGMISLRSCACSLDYVPIHFYVIWKPTFLPALELGALLSSYLVGVLHKFLNKWMNEYRHITLVIACDPKHWVQYLWFWLLFFQSQLPPSHVGLWLAILLCLGP